jgi:formylglycine-generating enzyme required for sulfatase activity
MFPQGNTDSQISDLAGNVWEWCHNKYDNPKNVEPGGDGARVLRGGSWGLNRVSARSEARFSLPPVVRSSDCGFRVVVSSPIQKR